MTTCTPYRWQTSATLRIQLRASPDPLKSTMIGSPAAPTASTICSKTNVSGLQPCGPGAKRIATQPPSTQAFRSSRQLRKYRGSSVPTARRRGCSAVMASVSATASGLIWLTRPRRDVVNVSVVSCSCVWRSRDSSVVSGSGIGLTLNSEIMSIAYIVGPFNSLGWWPATGNLCLHRPVVSGRLGKCTAMACSVQSPFQRQATVRRYAHLPWAGRVHSSTAPGSGSNLG